MIIGIVGLGLMGGSFGRMLVKKGYTVYGFDNNPDVMLKAELMQAILAPLTETNATEVDILVTVVKPSLFEIATERFLSRLKKGAIVTDFCGIKQSTVSVMKKWAEIYSDLTFIGGHPMAGREFSGIEHSSISLFEKASIILVPVKNDIFSLDRLKEFYLSFGFNKVVITDAKTHDAIIAYTSQLCHIVSNAFIKNKNAENKLGYSAGSFRDLTRVARLDADMWTELILSNRDNVLNELNELINNLSKYKVAIENENREELRTLFAEGNNRKIIIEQGKN